jgi:hypothetical protein
MKVNGYTHITANLMLRKNHDYPIKWVAGVPRSRVGYFGKQEKAFVSAE